MSRKLPHWLVRLGIYLSVIVLSVALMMRDAESDSYAADSFWPPLRLSSLGVKYRSFISPGRDALIYPNEHKEAIELNLNTDVLRFLYFDARVFGIVDQTQYRAVGLNTMVGARVTDWSRVEIEHLSEHILDGQHSFLPRFPVSDSFNILIDIYRTPAPRQSIFGD